MHNAFNNNTNIELRGEMKNSKWCYNHALALPIYNDLTHEMQEIIIKELVKNL